MNVEAFSHSKFKRDAKPGDDVLLVIPDRIYAVFDGATDPTGAIYDGESSGRFAARIAAHTITDLAMNVDGTELCSAFVLQALSDAVRREAARIDAGHPPSTTAAIVFDDKSHFRFLLVGDSGVRINGKQVHQHHKLVDRVSTAARIAVFNILAARNGWDDETEMTTRSIMFLGLSRAVRNGILSGDEAEAAIHAAVAATGIQREENAVREFLSGGIQIQHHYANRKGHIFGYASLNGGEMVLEGVEEFSYPKTEICSIEIFSDGYAGLPEGVRIDDWETEFNRIEKADFHKIGSYPSIKGSTTAEFCDDRTVVSLVRPG